MVDDRIGPADGVDLSYRRPATATGALLAAVHLLRPFLTIYLRMLAMTGKLLWTIPSVQKPFFLMRFFLDM